MIDLRLERRSSPVGSMMVVTDRDGVLRALDFIDYEARLRELLARHYSAFTLTEAPLAKPVAQALDAYFDGDLSAIVDLPGATGGTAFQRTVWAALRTIPAGTTLSYGALARQIGQPTASRAVGLANGSNPIAIVVPCHRVIGANGSLTGYAGGLPRKRWLLEHELRHSRAAAPAFALEMASGFH